MEQGSSSAPNQKRQSFTDELRAIVNSSSQDLSAEKEPSYSIPETSEYRSSNFDGVLNLSQTEQTQQIGGPSFSRGPLQEEMLSQFHGANVDLSAAYSIANLHSRHQLYQGNNAMMSGDEESNYNEMMNRYNLSSVSNMAPQFHLLTSNSSGHGGLQIGSSQTLVPFESSIIDSSVNTGIHIINAYSSAQAQNNAMPPENLASFRSMRSQGLPYPMSAPNGFDLGVDISNNAKTPTSALKAPFESSMTVPLIDHVAAQQAQNNATAVESSFPLRSVRGQGIPYLMNTASGFEIGSGSSSNGPTTSALKRKMSSQDDITPNYQSWNSFGRGLHRYSSSSSSNDGGRYTLYDKRYEDIGLPVDPHLRIFIAGNGNGESSSSKRKD